MTPSAQKKLPPEKYREVVDELAGLIPDPIKKLKLLNFAIGNYKPFKTYQNLRTIIDSIIATKTNPEEIQYFKSLKRRLRNSIFPYSNPLVLFAYKHRSVVLPVCLLFLVFSTGITVWMTRQPQYAENHSGEQSDYADQNSAMMTPVPGSPAVTMVKKGPDIVAIENADPRIPILPSPAEPPKEYPKYLNKVIWLVEKTKDSEIYSNRLKIITTFTTDNISRRYYTFKKDTPLPPAPDQEKHTVAGILYHASESDIFEFKPEMSDSIKKYSKALIKYLRKKKSYNYFIDRFGRVYRIVREDHAAFHAGNAVWADDTSIYLNLNHAFIGICYEGRDFETAESNTDSQKIVPMEEMSINEAQLISGKELTDWLRVKYNIPQGNCTPHCLVSLNRHNLLIGHHLDLSRGFPFDQYGLSNKYRETIPAITEFGCSYDQYFLDIFNGDIWPGIAFSERRLEKKAQEHGMSLDGYRKLLNNRFITFFDWQLEQEELYTKQEQSETPSKTKEVEFKVEKRDKI